MLPFADIGEFKHWVVGRLANTQTAAQRKFDETDASDNAAQIQKKKDALWSLPRGRGQLHTDLPWNSAIDITRLAQHDTKYDNNHIDAGSAATAWYAR